MNKCLKSVMERVDSDIENDYNGEVALMLLRNAVRDAYNEQLCINSDIFSIIEDIAEEAERIDSGRIQAKISDLENLIK